MSIPQNAAMEILREKGAAALTPHSAGVPPHAFHQWLKEVMPPSAQVERMDPNTRYLHILIAAVEVSEMYGFRDVTRADVAAAAGVATGLVSHYFQSMETLHQEVFHYAVMAHRYRLIGQAIFCKEPGQEKVTGEVRKKAKAAIWT